MREGTDTDWIERAVRGEPLALQRLLLRNCRRLTAHIAGKIPLALRARIEAEDILQEAFTDAFKRISAFQPGDSKDCFYNWLVTIAEHRLLDVIKRERATKRGGGRKTMDAAGSQLIGLLEMAKVSDKTPSSFAARREAIAAVQAAMKNLADDYRDVLQLRFISSLPLAKVAARMGRTEHATQMLCHRAVRQLHALMGRTSDYLTRKE